MLASVLLLLDLIDLFFELICMFFWLRELFLDLRMSGLLLEEVVIVCAELGNFLAEMYVKVMVSLMRSC